MLKYFLIFLLPFASLTDTKSQISICALSGTTEEDCINRISTVVPLLRVNVDAASGGMGDVGIALSSNTHTNAVFYNSSKMIFNEDKGGLSLNFVPWLRILGITDVYLTNLSGFYKINDFHAIGGSIRYFNLGELNFISHGFLDQFKPRELVVEIVNVFKLNEHFSVGSNLKYIYSSLNEGDMSTLGPIVPGLAIAADFSAFYTQKIELGNTAGSFNAGLSISNLGNKISYLKSRESKDFLPANLGIGTAVELKLNNHRLTFAYDLNKLLVPTPTINRSHKDKTALQGIFNSFADTSFEEELRELTHSMGIEFWFNNLLALRSGFYKEHKTKGNISYLTFGLGGKYKSVEANVSYIIPPQYHPLSRTFKFSLAYHL